MNSNFNTNQGLGSNTSGFPSRLTQNNNTNAFAAGNNNNFTTTQTNSQANTSGAYNSRLANNQRRAFIPDYAQGPNPATNASNIGNSPMILGGGSYKANNVMNRNKNEGFAAEGFDFLSGSQNTLKQFDKPMGGGSLNNDLAGIPSLGGSNNNSNSIGNAYGYSGNLSNVQVKSMGGGMNNDQQRQGTASENKNARPSIIGSGNTGYGGTSVFSGLASR